VSLVKNYSSVRETVGIAILLAFGVSAVTSPSHGQVPGQFPKGNWEATSVAASGRTAVPKNPKDLLLAAARVNGLEGPGIKPWHIVVRYENFDRLGDTIENGTYEEWWIAPNQYRISYSAPSFTQTEYGTPSGVYRVGDPSWPGVLQTQIRDEFVRPMFRELDLQFARAEKLHRHPKVHLRCLDLRPVPPKDPHIRQVTPERNMAKFCFEPGSLILRGGRGSVTRGTFGEQIYYDRILQFQDRYVAGEVHVARADRPFLKLQLEKLEAIEQSDPAILTPPADAMRIDDKPISPDASVLQFDYFLHREFHKVDPPLMPMYTQGVTGPQLTPPPPPCAPRDYVAFTVKGEFSLKFTITREGRVTAVSSTGGTRKYREAQEDEVKRHVYRPFLLRGEPVEVEVTRTHPYLEDASPPAPLGGWCPNGQ